MRIREREKKRRLKILVKICVIATSITIDWSAESMLDNTRFLYTCIYIDLVSVTASRLHALNKEIKNKLKNVREKKSLYLIASLSQKMPRFIFIKFWLIESRLVSHYIVNS